MANAFSSFDQRDSDAARRYRWQHQSEAGPGPVHGSGMFAGMGAHSDHRKSEKKAQDEKAYQLQLQQQIHEKRIRQYSQKLRERADAEAEENRVKAEI